MADMKFQETKQDFLNDLIAAREYREMDIQRVAEKTKISLDYLTKLERGEWDFLPHSYVRAFLRTYAQTVDMDVGEVLERFDRIVGVPSTPQATAKTMTPITPTKSKGGGGGGGSGQPKFMLADEDGGSSNSLLDSKQLIWWLSGAGAVALLAILYIFVIAPGSDSSSRSNDVDEIPFEDVVRQTEGNTTDDGMSGEADQMESDEGETVTPPLTTPQSSQPQRREPAPEPEATTRSAQNGGDSPSTTSGAGAADPEVAPPTLSLRAQATQACYLRVMSDRDPDRVVDTILSAGNTRSFAADSVYRVVLGNTDGITLFLGERQLTDLGRRGRVVTMTIDRNGVRDVQAGNRELEPAGASADTTDN